MQDSGPVRPLAWHWSNKTALPSDDRAGHAEGPGLPLAPMAEPRSPSAAASVLPHRGRFVGLRSLCTHWAFVKVLSQIHRKGLSTARKPGMKVAGSRRRSLDRLQSGWAEGVAATPGGCLTGRSPGEGQDQRGDCGRRHSGASLARESQACGKSGGGSEAVGVVRRGAGGRAVSPARC